MMWDYGGMNGWLWAWGFGALVIIGLVILAVVLIRVFSGPRQSTPLTPQEAAESPQQILDARYARGELTTEEYRERLSALGLDS